MKIKCNKSQLIIIVTLLAQFFLPIEYLLFALIGIILLETVFFNKEKPKLKRLPCESEYMFFIVVGALVGGIKYLAGSYTIRHYFKDILYMTLMALFWIIGSNLYTKRYVCSQKKDVLMAGTIYALVDLIRCIWKILLNNGLSSSLYELRSLIGTGGPIAMITLFWCMYFYNDIHMKKQYKNICVVFIASDICIHFSRMNILIAVIFIIYSGLIKRPKKLVKYTIIILLVVMIVSIISPEMLLLYVNKIFNSAKEISFTSKIWDRTSIIQNWRGYEVYCEMNKFSKVNILEKLFGGGFGTQLDVKGYAYLISTEDTIPFLHNGYFSILMIWGVVGVIVYISMLKHLFKRSKKYKKTVERRFWNSLVMLIAVDTFFVHGPFFSASVACIFLYLGILGMDEKRIEKRVY